VSQDPSPRADPFLTRLAEAILIPPFPGSVAPRWILDALGRGLAGVTLFGQNISTPDQVTTLTASLRAAAAAGYPVIAIDEEGGDVTRVAYREGSAYPGNAALGVVDDTTLTRSVYQAIGADLAALGISLGLAPCADVLGLADSPAVGTRSFGADTDLVSRHTAAAVAGLQDAGVAACTKHFPGGAEAWRAARRPGARRGEDRAVVGRSGRPCPARSLAGPASPTDTFFAHPFEFLNFLAVDSGSVVEKGDNSAPDQPKSPDQPRSLTGREHQECTRSSGRTLVPPATGIRPRQKPAGSGSARKRRQLRAKDLPG
jgi:hypothetical protein